MPQVGRAQPARNQRGTAQAGETMLMKFRKSQIADEVIE